MAAPTPVSADYPDAHTAWRAGVVLMICDTFAFVDRLILAFLVTPLKHDPHLRDTQVGLLQDFAFAMFYSVLGIPFGLAAGRVNRRNLIAAGVLASVCGAVAALCTFRPYRGDIAATAPQSWAGADHR